MEKISNLSGRKWIKQSVPLQPFMLRMHQETIYHVKRTFKNLFKLNKYQSGKRNLVLNYSQGLRFYKQLKGSS